MKLSFSTLLPFLPLLAAAPAPGPAAEPALTERQGGVFYAVSQLYSAGGCTVRIPLSLHPTPSITSPTLPSPPPLYNPPSTHPPSPQQQPIFATAVFGAADICQPLPSSIPQPVVSFNTTAIYQDLAPSLGCHGPLMLSFFTDEHCSQGRTVSELNHCEQASGPFRSLELECVM
ncbi:MAG: hypothetical protein Q9160_007506 [Pyrenula sp. 1 TL-2023]